MNNRMWILTTEDAAVDPPLVIRLPTSAARTVGRANLSDFILDAAMVSRVHCRLTTDSKGDLTVEDLDSTNGTFVNDRRVKTTAPLSPGDRLRVGRVELSVERASES
jgi:pSer/pThr/pTyr-binding forkhead associated (FHA) protein